MDRALHTSRIQLRTPAGFSFWRTVFSHGWCALVPFSVDKASGSLSRVLALKDGTIVRAAVSEVRGAVSISLSSAGALATHQKREAGALIGECLRINEDFSAFYAEARRYPHYRWIPKQGAGRLLRSPTAFEDAVKMICTTNCSWALTESMVENLTAALGESLGDHARGFPTAEAIAGTSEAYLRKQIRTGYRSPYLLEFATRVARHKLDPEQWRTSAASTEELFDEIRSVKGMGPYAAGNMLKLLGRYDYLGLDSWVRGQYYALHTRGRKVKDASIERRYKEFGRWRGLFFWLEMTRSWYSRKFPF